MKSMRMVSAAKYGKAQAMLKESCLFGDGAKIFYGEAEV